MPRVFILQVHRKKVRLYFNALLAQNSAAFQAIALLQNRITRSKSALLICGKLIAQIKAVTLIVDFKYMRPCVSSPRVSKGCFGKAHVDAEGITFEAALADARATDKAHTTENRFITSLNLSLELKMRFIDYKGLIGEYSTLYYKMQLVSSLFTTCDFNSRLRLNKQWLKEVCRKLQQKSGEAFQLHRIKKSIN